jgi:4a-hydroxytetrahydrobiopterin dehydratase
VTPDEPLMPEADVDAALVDLDWERQGDVLVKVVRRRGFAGALSFVVAVGALAEAADHHPDIDIRWDTVTLRLTTHSAGGLTGKDLDLAGQIDRLLEEGLA